MDSPLLGSYQADGKDKMYSNHGDGSFLLVKLQVRFPCVCSEGPVGNLS